MTMPPFAEDPEDVAAVLRARCASWRPPATQRWAGTHAFDVLSMGTSQDYAVAAAEGATIVRLGSVLYGGRPTQ